MKERDAMQGECKTPVLVKIAPDLTARDKQDIADVVTAVGTQFYFCWNKTEKCGSNKGCNYLSVWLHWNLVFDFLSRLCCVFAAGSGRFDGF